MDLAKNSTRDRRLFLKSGVASMAALGLSKHLSTRQATAETVPTERVSIGIMGVNGRGGAIARNMLATGQVVGEHTVALFGDFDRRQRPLRPDLPSDGLDRLRDDRLGRVSPGGRRLHPQQRERREPTWLSN